MWYKVVLRKKKKLRIQIFSRRQKPDVLNITVMEIQYLYLVYIINISTNGQKFSTLIITNSLSIGVLIFNSNQKIKI